MLHETQVSFEKKTPTISIKILDSVTEKNNKPKSNIEENVCEKIIPENVIRELTEGSYLHVTM